MLSVVPFRALSPSPLQTWMQLEEIMMVETCFGELVQPWLDHRAVDM
jgi:hypothetical protein